MGEEGPTNNVLEFTRDRNNAPPSGICRRGGNRGGIGGFRGCWGKDVQSLPSKDLDGQEAKDNSTREKKKKKGMAKKEHAPGHLLDLAFGENLLDGRSRKRHNQKWKEGSIPSCSRGYRKRGASWGKRKVGKWRNETNKPRSGEESSKNRR